MAVQQIRNIINNQVEGQILKAKSQVKTEANKQILKIQEKLPTTEDLKSQFLSVACSEAAKKKIDFLYNKISKFNNSKFKSNKYLDDNIYE